MTTTNLNTKINEVERKTPDTSGLVTTTVLNTKSAEVENKNTNYAKYVTPTLNKLTAENFEAKLKQANSVTKTDFDDKLTSFIVSGLPQIKQNS